MDNDQINTDFANQPDDEIQKDLEAQIEEASRSSSNKKDQNGNDDSSDQNAPDFGTAKEQLNREDGIEIL